MVARPNIPHILPTGDYRQDVDEALYRQGEDMALAFLERMLADKGWRIEDLRPLRIHGDFALISPKGKRIVVDVKVDQQSETSKRFVWERAIAHPDGHEERGWGTSGHVDWVMVVEPHRFGMWPGAILDAHLLREFAESQEARYSERELKAMGWLPISKKNTDGRRALGWAIPKDVLDDVGVIRREFYV